MWARARRQNTTQKSCLIKFVSEEPEHLPRKILTNSLKFYAASSVLEGEESATSDFRDRNDTEFEEVPTIVST